MSARMSPRFCIDGLGESTTTRDEHENSWGHILELRLVWLSSWWPTKKRRSELIAAVSMNTRKLLRWTFPSFIHSTQFAQSHWNSRLKNSQLTLLSRSLFTPSLLHTSTLSHFCSDFQLYLIACEIAAIVALLQLQYIKYQKDSKCQM